MVSLRLLDAILGFFKKLLKKIINNIHALQGEVSIFSGSTQYKMSSVFYRLLQCGAFSDGFLQGSYGYLLLFLLSLRRNTKFSLPISLTNETLIFQLQKRNFVSPSSHVMFDLLYVNTTEMPNHSHFFFGAKGMIYNVTIATMIFSHMKITVTLFG